MSVKNRMSISLSEEQLEELERLAIHHQMPRSKIIRIILDDFLAGDRKRFDLALQARSILKHKESDG